jgi:hypothetical protein
LLHEKWIKAMSKPECMTLRQVGGSLYLRIPSDYVRENQLTPGDIVLWWPGEKIRIVKQEKLASIVGQAEELEATA